MVAGASGSKVVAGTKKTAMPARKRHVLAIGVMAEASSTESQKSSPHVLAAPDSLFGQHVDAGASRLVSSSLVA
jgi:hypothetical protein